MRSHLKNLRSRSAFSYDAVLVRLIGHDLERRRRVAASTNPRYAELERLRTNPNGTITLFSTELGLTMREWHEQSAVLDSIPRAWWAPLVDFLRSHPLRSRVKSARRATQRARRGWDDSALWGLDHHLCSTLGSQLAALSTTTNSWPDHLCDSFEEWKQLLVINAGYLLAYASSEESLEEHTLHELLADPDADDSVIDAATSAAVDARARTVSQAQSALRWVADVLPSLWD